jgi:hypothetical protein
MASKSVLGKKKIENPESIYASTTIKNRVLILNPKTSTVVLPFLLLCEKSE